MTAHDWAAMAGSLFAIVGAFAALAVIDRRSRRRATLARLDRIARRYG